MTATRRRSENTHEASRSPVHVISPLLTRSNQGVADAGAVESLLIRGAYAVRYSILVTTSGFQSFGRSLQAPANAQTCLLAEAQILGRRKHPLHSLRIIGVVGLPFDVVAAALAAAGAASHCTTEVWASTDDNHVVYLRPVDGVMVPTLAEGAFRTLDWGSLDRRVPRLFDSLMNTFSQTLKPIVVDACATRTGRRRRVRKPRVRLVVPPPDLSNEKGDFQHPLAT